MKVVALGLAALAATGCMARSSSSSGGRAAAVASTALTIEISASKSDRLTRVWTLICPNRGTLPQASRACRRLNAVKKPFAPVAKNASCTLVYGGPQIADVRGRFRGHRVHTRFTRADGCEIARWNRVRFLFPDT